MLFQKNTLEVDGQYSYYSWSLQQVVLVFLLVLVIAPLAIARQGKAPTDKVGVVSAEGIRSVTLPAIDSAAPQTKNQRAIAPGPLQIAHGMDISITLDNGTWETLRDGSSLWRVRVDGPGALHLNFGFGIFDLPEGTTLHLYSTNDPALYIGPYTSADNSSNGLWTPIVPGNSAVIEIHVAAGVDRGGVVIEVTRVGLGTMDLFKIGGPKHNLAACHIDVVCPEATAFSNEVRSVVRLLINNSGLCTGTLINDVPGSFKPFILTANHCTVTSQQVADTVVALFNFDAPTCGGTGGPLTDTVSGAFFRATRNDVDGTLLELKSTPPSSFNVFYSGWDRSNSVPNGTVGIHHPFGENKAYSEDTNAPITVHSCIGTNGLDSHWEVQWTLGTTLPGSSGSALFDINSKKLIGHLSGGVGRLCWK